MLGLSWNSELFPQPAGKIEQKMYFFRAACTGAHGSWRREISLCPMLFGCVRDMWDIGPQPQVRKFPFFCCLLNVFLPRLDLGILGNISPTCNVFKVLLNIGNLHSMSSKTSMGCLAFWITWFCNKKTRNTYANVGFRKET